MSAKVESAAISMASNVSLNSWEIKGTQRNGVVSPSEYVSNTSAHAESAPVRLLLSPPKADSCMSVGKLLSYSTNSSIDALPLYPAGVLQYCNTSYFTLTALL